MKNDNRILRVNMANIRRKIEKNPAEPRYILQRLASDTDRGAGLGRDAALQRKVNKLW